MNSGNRPLSPHLQIYRPQLTSILSITHRATGVALALGLIAVAYWLGAAAYGEAPYAHARAIFGSGIGKLALMGWSFCLFYHVCNGIRHLRWDTGKGLSIPEVYFSGKVVVVCALALTILSWLIAFTR
jgi:succinate dehydrogenase / fumarate reductase cytochrome b subunit